MASQPSAGTAEFGAAVAEMIASGQFTMPMATDDPIIGYQDVEVDP